MTRRPRIAAAACLAALAAAAAGCGSTTAPSGPSRAAITASMMPLDTASTTAAGTWATVVMGGSAAQHNNFWQLFIRPAGSSQWKLVTPPGTADNGGLVLAGTGQALITAFRPSQDLTYTPLSQTSDAGQAWSAVNPLDAALASTPGALAMQPGTSRLLALLSSGTAEQSAPGGTHWTTLITARALAATPAGRSCGLRTLTAVAYSPAGTPLLAGTCSRPGSTGIFAAVGRSWQRISLALPGAIAHQPVSVLRLGSTGNQTTALLAAGSGPDTALVAAWSADGTSWTASPLLRTAGRAVTAASLGPGPAAAVLFAGGRGAVLARGRWQLLPALPPTTAALAPGPGGSVDALAVHQSTLTIWRLADEQGNWAREQVISVPIQYGSSS